MKLYPKSLRFRLYAWYFGSLILLSIYFYVIVHILMLPHSDHIFMLLISLMGIFGFLVIYKITTELTKLTHQVRTITSEHLEKRVKGVKGGEELEELASSFNEVLNNVDAAFKREQQFIGDVAHELKTPIATLKSSLEVALSKDRTKEEYQHIIQEALIDADHLSAILKNILDLAWTETLHDHKNTEKVNLSAIVEDMYEIAQRLALHKKLKITGSITKNIYICGFKDKLARALLNVVDNAIQYTETGTVDITVKSIRDKAFVLIKDTGPGIPTKEIPHIFNRFYRGKTTDKVFGSGLGLAIARSMITIHKGTIEVESKIGYGSTFIISFPLASS